MDYIESDKIYTDFEFELDYGEKILPIGAIAPVNGGQFSWGNHTDKPVQQTKWEQTVRTECENIMVNDGAQYFPYLHIPQICSTGSSQDKNVRPYMKDPKSERWMLVDTGAVVTVWPKADFPEAKLNDKLCLQAVNRSKIPTFGTRIKDYKIGRKTYRHEVILADVAEPVIGFDFLRKFLLSLIWDLEEKQMDLVDKKASITKRLSMRNIHSGTLLSLAPVETNTAEDMHKTFQQYSQAQSQKSQDAAEPEIIPKKYKRLLDKYPEVLKENFKIKTPKHGVVHTIQTGNCSPCHAKVRPLMPGSPKAIKAEKNCRELENLGIVEMVKATEATPWTSAIHLVPKPDGDWRCTGDFRHLNDKTVLDAYPLPNIRHFTSKIRGSKLFSRIDLKKAFHHVPLDEASQLKTASVTPWGTFK